MCSSLVDWNVLNLKIDEADINATINSEWTAMDATRKSIYTHKAQKDTARYRRQQETNQDSDDARKHQHVITE